MPLDVATSFQKFVSELGSNLGQSPTDGTTPLSKAYYGFWAAYNKHK